MTMYSLEMRKQAEEGCLNILRQSHGWLNEWITTLKDTNLEVWVSLPFDSTAVPNLSNWYYTMRERRNKLRDWKDNYGLDIDVQYGSDYQEALDGAITSFTNLMDHIDTMVQTNYWYNGEPLVSEVSQTHRDSLASDFEDELPTSEVLACAPSFTLTITADLTVV